jgi:DmsE family decaheme c-type cytochrome
MKRALFALAALLTLVAWLGAPPTAAQSAEGDSSGLSCADCHEDMVIGMASQVHMRIEPFEVGGRVVGCEGCHGDGTQHMESGGDASLIKVFDEEGSGDASCLECHQGRGLHEWNASTHAREEVSCSSCHRIHQASKPLSACLECHGNVVAQTQLPFRHPLREGMMSCSSCHNPHASTEHQILTHERTSEMCFRCHQDKQGPFIFEHPPVQEDCSLCHNPHGSVHRGMLAMGDPALCLQCHEFHFHAGYKSADGEVEIGGFPRESPLGAFSFNAGFTTRCGLCHQRVHGSDLPTQGTPSRGRGLGR